HKEIQVALINISQLQDRIDGIFGTRTRIAIKAFQTLNGFNGTGYLSSDQQQLLLRQIAAPGNTKPPATSLSTRAVSPELQTARVTCRKAEGQSAVSACNRLINSGQFGAEDLAEIFKDRGTAYEKMGNLAESIINYRKALKLTPSNSTAVD